MLMLRKLVKRIKGLAYNQFTRHRRHPRDHAEIAARHPHGEGVHAGRGHAAARRRKYAVVERKRQQMALGRQPLEPADGDLGGFAIRARLPLYGGYSVVALGATPTSSSPSCRHFLPATEPAKKAPVATTSTSTDQLVGARMLWKSTTARRANPRP